VKVLLMGAYGQLGAAVRRVFTRHDVETPEKGECDVADVEAVESALDRFRPDAVLNSAAYTAVDAAEDDVATAYRVNRDGARVLAEASARRGIPLLHVSTDYVFDGEKGAPYVESDPTHPLQVYGASKLAGEEAVRRANRRHWIARTAWLYGPVGKNFAFSIRAAAAREAKLRVVDDQWGSPTYAPHLAAALERLLESREYGTFHLANAGVASRFELAGALLQALGSRTPLEPVPTSAWPTRARRPRNTALASERGLGLALPDWREGVHAFAAAVGAG
jgi:dTDP-4-dehydrorhamnose reductase